MILSNAAKHNHIRYQIMTQEVDLRVAAVPLLYECVREIKIVASRALDIK